jgi:growth arrest-specific protein 8
LDQVGKEKKKDGLLTGDVEGASIEELNQKIGTLEKEKNKEEEYRNYMQLERVSA